MINYEFKKSNGEIFRRVTKRAAVRAMKNNPELNIIFCPCNLRPGEPWYPEFNTKGSLLPDFEKAINEFEYYNCNKETGLYTAFYIQIA